MGLAVPGCGVAQAVAASSYVLGRDVCEPPCALVDSYSAVMVPYRIGFKIDADGAWEVIDYATDILFALDIIINFFTGYISDLGNCVRDPPLVARHYLKVWLRGDVGVAPCVALRIGSGAIRCAHSTLRCPVARLQGWFTIDFLSTFPFDWSMEVITSSTSSQFRLTKLLRTLRLFRLLKLARFIKLEKLFGHYEDAFSVRRWPCTTRRLRPHCLPCSRVFCRAAAFPTRRMAGPPLARAHGEAHGGHAFHCPHQRLSVVWHH